jgi:hypothetical protein
LGHTVQLPPSAFKLSLANHKVSVSITENNKAYFLYDNRIVFSTMLSEKNKSIKKKQIIENILSKKAYISENKKSVKPYIPPKNHPWRNFQLSSKHKEVVLC